MPHAHELRRADQMRADRDLLQQAAAALRQDVATDRLAGLQRPEAAYCVAGLLDSLALQIWDLSGLVRTEAVRAARVVLGGRLV